MLLLILSPCLGMKRMLPLPSPLKKWNFKLVWSWGRDFSSYFPPTFQGKKGSVPKLIYFCFFSPYLFLSHRVFGWFCSLLTLICQCCLVFFNLIYSIFVYLLRGIKGCVRFGKEKKGEIKKKTSDAVFPPFFQGFMGIFVGFWIKICAFLFSRILCFPTGSQRSREFGGQRERVSPGF